MLDLHRPMAKNKATGPDYLARHTQAETTIWTRGLRIIETEKHCSSEADVIWFSGKERLVEQTPALHQKHQAACLE